MNSSCQPSGAGRVVTLEFLEFDTASDAVCHVESTGQGLAIRMGGRHYVVSEKDAEWMRSFGSVFFYQRRIAGRIVSVRPRRRRKKSDLTASARACPRCGDSYTDRQVWISDETMRCGRCGTLHDPTRP